METARNRRICGNNALLELFGGTRHVPWPSAMVHGARWPFSSPLYPARQSNTRRFETCETFVSGRTGWKGGGPSGPIVRNPREKAGPMVNPPFWRSVVFRRVRWGVARFRGGPFCPRFRSPLLSPLRAAPSRWPFSALLYSTCQPIPGVSKPPKRRVLAMGGGKGETRGVKAQKPRQISGF